MSLSVGIVGLPNAGKSTLFNALASRRLAETAPRPFTTIDPHEAVVSVPDKYLKKLWDLVKKDLSNSPAKQVKIIPAFVTFIDIAGLVKGAHQGEGLGNQFLSKIREVDALVHVVRAFVDPGISHQHPSHEPGSFKQIIEDIDVVNLELELADIPKKPIIYVLNIGEQDLGEFDTQDHINKLMEKYQNEVVAICADLEEELIDLNELERAAYLHELEIEKTGLELLIQKAYLLLDLITFYTIKGGKEVRAWSLKRGLTALDAAEKVHTDFAKNFIKAEVILVERLLEIGSWKKAKENGLIRLEGKDYIVQNRDVVEFKVGV